MLGHLISCNVFRALEEAGLIVLACQLTDTVKYPLVRPIWRRHYNEGVRALVNNNRVVSVVDKPL
jgi:hypothetical protein